MKHWTNGYGEEMYTWEVGDHGIFKSRKYPELAPYEVRISGISVDMDRGHPAYLRHTEPSGDDSGWQLYESYSIPVYDATRRS